MHGINLTADMDARTLIPADPSAKIGASADEGSDSIAVTFSPALPEGAVADIVYGVIVRMNGTIGHPFSRLDTDGDCVVPSQVLAGCIAGTLPVSVRVTYADGSVGCTPEVVLGVDMVPDPVTEAESKGFPLLMTRDSSWAWEKSWVYQKGSMVTYGDSVYVSTANDNVGNVPDSLVGWKLATESATVWGGITGTLANQRDLADALAGKADASALNALGQTVAGKQDALTFDSAPTAGSVNPVTSGGVYTALDGKVSKSGDIMNGILGFDTQTNWPVIQVKTSAGAVGTTGSDLRTGVQFLDKNGKELAMWLGAYSPDGYSESACIANNNINGVSKSVRLSVIHNLDGTAYVSGITPPSNIDNSTKVPTTAWVYANPHIVRTIGNQRIEGLKTFADNVAISNAIYCMLGVSMKSTTADISDAAQTWSIPGFTWLDKNHKGVIWTKLTLDTASRTNVVMNYKYDNENSGGITLYSVDRANKKLNMYAPTPSDTANNTEVATTAWVRALIDAKIQEALNQ